MSAGRRLTTLATLAVTVTALLAAGIIYWQMVRGDQLLPPWLNPYPIAASASDQSSLSHLNDLPQPVLQRTGAFLNSVQRGAIYDHGGRLLASDQVGANGDRTRFYTEPSLAHVIGYTSPYRIGLAGLELTYNTTLLGLDRVDARLEQALHQPLRGSDLVLTIDSGLQRSADRALAGKAGAAIVLDAHTGAVLAMASAPDYDPNRVLEAGYASGLDADCGGVSTCAAPFLNRATQALYPPGSTFKTLALIAALDSGQLTTKTIFDFGKPLTGPGGTYYVYNVTGGGTIVDYNHREAQLTLAQSYAHSANAAFAKIGDEMPADVLVDYAGRFGFSASDPQKFALEVESSPSQLASPVSDLYTNNMLRASTAIGQGELLATPASIAMLVMAVENGGSLPLPYLVESVKDPTGRVIQTHPAKKTFSGLMKAETAAEVRDMMISVVKSGTGGNAAVPGLVVGGKTGTAQVAGTANPHAWFVGFAEGKDRAVVIVVVIENGGEGAVAAAPIFAQLAKQAVSLP